MPAAECAPDIAVSDLENCNSQAGNEQIDAPIPAPSGSSKPLKVLLGGFAVTIAIGLALGVWYLHQRIVMPGQSGSGSSTTIASAQSSAPLPQGSAWLNVNTANPPALPLESQQYVPPVHLYLQVGGLGIKEDTVFANLLLDQGFHAQVQMRDGKTTRILIGPFSSQAELEQAQHRLHSVGILAIETPY